MVDNPEHADPPGDRRFTGVFFGFSRVFCVTVRQILTLVELKNEVKNPEHTDPPIIPFV